MEQGRARDRSEDLLVARDDFDVFALRFGDIDPAVGHLHEAGGPFQLLIVWRTFSAILPDLFAVFVDFDQIPTFRTAETVAAGDHRVPVFEPRGQIRERNFVAPD